MTIRVFLADDHAVLRDGIKVLLEAQPDIDVIGDASDGHEALQKIEQLKPHVAILDIAMPTMTGLEAAQRLSQTCPATRVIILSMHKTPNHIQQALQAGVRSYVLKESAGSEVIDAVRMVHAGNCFMSPVVAETIVQGFLSTTPSATPLSNLNEREIEILELVVEGKTNAEIAQLLAVSPRTVDTYRSRIMQKLNINSLPKLVKFAIQHGLTSLE